MGAFAGPDNILEERLIRLMEQYEKDLLRMCCLSLRDWSLAEDAVQETFFKAYQALGRFRGDCSEKTWLMSIAINTCKNMRRSAWLRFAENRVSLTQLPSPAPNAEGGSIALTEEVMRLPRKYQEVLLLHYYQGMKGKEIAQALGVSGAAVSKRLKQARASHSPQGPAIGRLPPSVAVPTGHTLPYAALCRRR